VLGRQVTIGRRGAVLGEERRICQGILPVLLDRSASVPVADEPIDCAGHKFSAHLPFGEDVGTVTSLHEHLASRDCGPLARRVDCYFDLADPGTYLAAERVERLPASVCWRPAALPTPPELALSRFAARARALRLPLLEPERVGPVPRAMRAAAHAAELGRGAPFVLAATRLAFCGGFDLEDPEVLAEALAAAGVGLDDGMAAAADAGRDVEIARAGRLIAAHGATQTPALRVGHMLLSGEARVGEAAAALRRAPLRVRRLG
jgi:2-hydroxychromene-2-carboxylate isomerase